MKLNHNPDKDYNKRQLNIGTNIELEHPDYYKELVKMEKKLENKG